MNSLKSFLLNESTNPDFITIPTPKSSNAPTEKVDAHVCYIIINGERESYEVTKDGIEGQMNLFDKTVANRVPEFYGFSIDELITNMQSEWKRKSYFPSKPDKTNTFIEDGKLVYISPIMLPGKPMKPFEKSKPEMQKKFINGDINGYVDVLRYDLVTKVIPVDNERPFEDELERKLCGRNIGIDNFIENELKNIL